MNAVVWWMEVVASEVKTGEEGFKGRVAVDEGGEDDGPILDKVTEGEEEEGEKEKGEGIGGEGGGGLFDEVRRRPQIVDGEEAGLIGHRENLSPYSALRFLFFFF